MKSEITVLRFGGRRLPRPLGSLRCREIDASPSIGGSLDEAGVRAFVKENLASYKAPRDVVFLPELPRNATGKILKRQLQ